MNLSKEEEEEEEVEVEAGVLEDEHLILGEQSQVQDEI